MPIRWPPPVVCHGDVKRGGQIADEWKLWDRLAHADAEVVARAIAQGIAEGRRHGLELARTRPEWSRDYGSNRRETTTE